MDPTLAMVVGMDHAQVMEAVSESIATATMIGIISNHAVVSLTEEARISREGQEMVTAATE